jgi:hypothetical protein
MTLNKLYILSLILILGFTACKKSQLQLPNPNAPTPQSALTTEDGIKSYALGIIARTVMNVPQEGLFNIMEIAWDHHIIMGDEAFIPYGNFGFRWSNQVYKITLPNGSSFLNPFGVTQKTSLQGFNSREAGERNVFVYEWTYCYYFIKQANTILASLDNPALKFSGDATTKRETLRAWALWWKGYSYSRIGSIYIAGIINNDSTFSFSPNNHFVTNQEILTEADRNFDACINVLNTLSPNDDYYNVMQAITPSFSDNSIPALVTPQSWIRQIYSYKARNLLVNKKTRDMTTGDWNQIITLTDQGLTSSDNIFKKGLTPDGNNDISGFTFPYLLTNQQNQWLFVSERLIQEFKQGDARLARNFSEEVDFANIRGRGLQFGTRWIAINIEDGGSYATINQKGYLNYACTYEENALTKAEALIHLGQVDEGLQIVDAIRSYQHANLAAVAGTGLSQTQALEELRRERRVALFYRGTAFYDARRWGVTEPAANGGGRANAIVYLPATVLNSSSNQALPCFMEYNYMDYFDVPQNELDFNEPGPGSAPVKS